MSSFWSPKRSQVAQVLISILQNTIFWEKRWEIESYIWKCIAKGFCSTDDQIRLCAQRWMKGKRKVTPPGTLRKKKEAKERAKFLANIPLELIQAIDSVLAKNEKAIEQYKAGNEKAVNALIGQVMKLYRSDASVIKELLVGKM